jgi:hypothetical protein
MPKFLLPAFLLALIAPVLGRPVLAAPAAAPVVAHLIEARIDPGSGEIRATDRLTLPEDADSWDLILHTGLSPKVIAGAANIESRGREGHLDLLRLRLTGPGPVTLAYGGRIRHALSSVAEGMGRERQFTAGTISPQGVFLDGASGWYPRAPDSLQTFELRVELPEGWHAVSQGEGPERPGLSGDAWAESRPQDDIYLVAAPFTLYREPGPAAEAQVWLRQPAPDLAAAYLAATREYLHLYSRLIGPYPYAKFALVENFWETGYGMPSFTLLGPQVIRLPFIIRTSYPHEVLHNWWGNGVYVDYAGGNWSEGLTAYLADHLMKELGGQGSEYRRDALKTYADYVRDAVDFPLTAFRARHGSASQAIGYGKSAMLFHMLRRQLGDDRFKQGLQRFYADNRFRTASWDDLRQAFERVSGRDLGAFFTAWTTRTGAPRLALDQVKVEQEGIGFRVSGQLDQIQPEAPFPLTVPVVIHLKQGPPREEFVSLEGRYAQFRMDLPSPPVRLAVDPAFDTFRDLMPGESPVALSNLFGSERGLILVPSEAGPGLRDGYRSLAESWVKGHPGWEIASDGDTRQLPKDRAVWLLGWENRFAKDFAESGRGFTLDPAAGHLKLGESSYSREDVSPVLTASHQGQPLGWLAAGDPTALPGLARKLPHYGKYGYLVFSGQAPENIAKGQWPPGDSALVHWFGEARPDLAPLPEPPLVRPEES